MLVKIALQIVRNFNGTCQVRWRLIVDDGTNLCGNVGLSHSELKCSSALLSEQKVHWEVIRPAAHFSRHSASFRCSCSVALTG